MKELKQFIPLKKNKSGYVFDDEELERKLIEEQVAKRLASVAENN